MLDDVLVPGTSLVGQLHQGWPVIERMLEVANGLLCAQVVGATRKAVDMAIDYAKNGIRVNVICPGPTDTPMLRKALTAEELEAFAKTFPMGRLGRPEEIAGAALFLASEDASLRVGSRLGVEPTGGWHRARTRLAGNGWWEGSPQRGSHSQ